MMPLTSTTNAFRKTVVHRFGDWNSYSLVDLNNNEILGIVGNAFVPAGNSWVYYAGSPYLAGLDTCGRVSIFYSLPSGMKVPFSYTINKEEKQAGTLVSSNGVHVSAVFWGCGQGTDSSIEVGQNQRGTQLQHHFTANMDDRQKCKTERIACGTYGYGFAAVGYGGRYICCQYGKNAFGGNCFSGINRFYDTAFSVLVVPDTALVEKLFRVAVFPCRQFSFGGGEKRITMDFHPEVKSSDIQPFIYFQF
jgi:hypothetical protein